MPAETKKTFEITVRDNTGQDNTLTIEAERAEEEAAGALRLFNGEEQVGRFISVVSWFDTSAVKQ